MQAHGVAGRLVAAQEHDRRVDTFGDLRPRHGRPVLPVAKGLQAVADPALLASCSVRVDCIGHPLGDVPALGGPVLRRRVVLKGSAWRHHRGLNVSILIHERVLLHVGVRISHAAVLELAHADIDVGDVAFKPRAIHVEAGLPQRVALIRPIDAFAVAGQICEFGRATGEQRLFLLLVSLDGPHQGDELAEGKEVLVLIQILVGAGRRVLIQTDLLLLETVTLLRMIACTIGFDAGGSSQVGVLGQGLLLEARQDLVDRVEALPAVTEHYSHHVLALCKAGLVLIEELEKYSQHFQVRLLRARRHLLTGQRVRRAL